MGYPWYSRDNRAVLPTGKVPLPDVPQKRQQLLQPILAHLPRSVGYQPQPAPTPKPKVEDDIGLCGYPS